LKINKVKKGVGLQRETDNKKRHVRVTINPKDVPESLGDEFKDTVCRWIEKGKINDNFDQKIDDLERKTFENFEKINAQLENISYLLACLTEQSLSANTIEQFKIEKLKAKSSLNADEKNVLALYKIRYKKWEKLKKILEIFVDTSELLDTED
jgi:hypothetical protein